MVADGELPSGLNWGNVAVEPPRDAAHGDMATNAAMVLAKPAGQPPRQIAESLAKRLKGGRIAVAEVAGRDLDDFFDRFIEPVNEAGYR